MESVGKMRLISMGNGRTSACKGFAVAALVAAISVAFTGVAYADNIQDSIVDTGTGISLVAGSATEGTATIRVVGNGDGGGGSSDPGCNWDPEEGDLPLVLDVVTPAGVTANPDPLSITACGVDRTVTFTASATAVSGTATVSITSSPAGGGSYNNQVSIPITVISANTKPSVAVTGVTDGATYQIGSVPTAICSVTDTQDGPSTHAAALSGALSHGLGTQTATCDYTDKGGLKADTTTATYSIIDTGNPTISHTLSPASPNGSNGWYTSAVTVDFTCSDGGAGIQSCTGDTTLGNGANQSASGTATDWAGNTATDNVTGINIDGLAPNAPTASLSPAANPAGWNNTSVTVSFASAGDNGASGVASCSADVPVTAETAGQTVTGTCTDRAGNVSALRQVTVKLDKTGPVISEDVTVNGTKGNGDWYVSPVEVTFTATDALSGPASANQKVTTSSDGHAVDVLSPAFTDTAGNTTAAGAVKQTFQIDTVAPSVGAPELTGTLGSNGWYRSAVTASFTASDATSGVAGTNPRTVTSSTQGTGIVLSSPAFSDVAGNTTAAGAQSATVMIDSQAPNAPTASFSPVHNAAGWNNSNVVVSFASAGDNGASGVARCSADVPVSLETGGETVAGTCTDEAGNTSAPTEVTVKLDKTAPVVSHDVTVDGTEGNGDWYTSDVKVTFTGTDALSGPATATKSATSSGQGTAVQVQSPAFTDTAGNSSAIGAVTRSYQIDKDAPTVGDAAFVSGTLGRNGWYRSAVTVSFTATDNVSGVVGDQTRNVSSSQQGTGIVLESPEFSDVAGNVTDAGNKKSATFKVDSEAPSVSLLNGPEAGESYYFGSVPAAPGCVASDTTPGSGLADADEAVAEMQDCKVTGYATGKGTHTVTATATDLAGNSTSVTRTYTVLAWTVNGFYAPIDKGIHNTVKGGATVPLKFELFAGNTELTDVSAVDSFVAQKVTCDSTLGSDSVETTSTLATTLRYDTTGGQFIQNWKTPSGAGNCFRVTMTAKDGTAISALFKTK
jgi:hypothetical protein